MIKKLAISGVGLLLLATPLVASAQATNADRQARLALICPVLSALVQAIAAQPNGQSIADSLTPVITALCNVSSQSTSTTNTNTNTQNTTTTNGHGAPTAYLSATANGVSAQSNASTDAGKTLTVNVGDTIVYSWNATNASNGSGTVSVDSADACGYSADAAHPSPWVDGNSTSGSDGTRAVAACQAGHTYVISYTATRGNSGQSAVAKITVHVNGTPTTPTPTTPTASGNPTATLTAYDARTLQSVSDANSPLAVQVGDYVTYTWTSSNGVSYAGTVSVDSADGCGFSTNAASPSTWGAGTNAASPTNGLVSTVATCQGQGAGGTATTATHTYTITYTVTGAAGTQPAVASVKLAVSPATQTTTSGTAPTATLRAYNARTVQSVSDANTPLAAQVGDSITYVWSSTNGQSYAGTVSVDSADGCGFSTNSASPSTWSGGTTAASPANGLVSSVATCQGQGSGGTVTTATHTYTITYKVTGAAGTQPSTASVKLAVSPVPAPSAPSITSLSAQSATAGSTLTITGSGFDQNTSVRFAGSSGGANATISSLTSTSITVTVPTLSPGSYTITASSLAGASSGTAFTISNTTTATTPTIASLSQTNFDSTSCQAVNVTVTGTNFDASNNWVSVNGTGIQGNVPSTSGGTQLVFSFNPCGWNAGSYPVVVRNSATMLYSNSLNVSVAGSTTNNNTNTNTNTGTQTSSAPTALIQASVNGGDWQSGTIASVRVGDQVNYQFTNSNCVSETNSVSIDGGAAITPWISGTTCGTRTTGNSTITSDQIPHRYVLGYKVCNAANLGGQCADSTLTISSVVAAASRASQLASAEAALKAILAQLAALAGH